MERAVNPTCALCLVASSRKANKQEIAAAGFVAARQPSARICGDCMKIVRAIELRLGTNVRALIKTV